MNLIFSKCLVRKRVVTIHHNAPTSLYSVEHPISALMDRLLGALHTLWTRSCLSHYSQELCEQNDTGLLLEHIVTMETEATDGLHCCSAMEIRSLLKTVAKTGTEVIVRGHCYNGSRSHCWFSIITFHHIEKITLVITATFQPTFLKSEVDEITCLSICPSRSSWHIFIKLSTQVTPVKVASTPQFLPRSFNHSKIGEVQSSDVGAKLATVCLGLSLMKPLSTIKTRKDHIGFYIIQIRSCQSLSGYSLLHSQVECAYIKAFLKEIISISSTGHMNCNLPRPRLRTCV